MREKKTKPTNQQTRIGLFKLVLPLFRYVSMTELCPKNDRGRHPSRPYSVELCKHLLIFLFFPAAKAINRFDQGEGEQDGLAKKGDTHQLF